MNGSVRLLLCAPLLLWGTTARAEPKDIYVYLIRGASPNQAEGIPVLANKLRLLKTPHRFHVADYPAAKRDKLIADVERNAGRPGKRILIGHSAGGAAALHALPRPDPRNTRLPAGIIWVDLVITIDPVGGPSRIATFAGGRLCSDRFERFTGPHAINYFVTSGAVHGHAVDGARNFDYTDERHSCVVGRNHTFSHTTIDDCELIMQRIIDAILEEASTPWCNNPDMNFPWFDGMDKALDRGY